MKRVISTAVACAVVLAAVAVPGLATAGRAGQRPGDELKGLNTLSVVVEGLGATAAACGVKEGAIEAAATRSLSDAGLKVASSNSDEDTYLYVNVNATRVGAVCVSRYDVILYTNTTARLPYGSTPALVQVSLLREAGMTGGDAAANGEAVLKAVRQAAEQFAARIKDANK